MSVRYTATWYDVTQARQQEHTPYTQTRTGPAGRSSVVRTENTCRPGRYGRDSSLQGGQQAGLFVVPARPALNRGGADSESSGQYTLYS